MNTVIFDLDETILNRSGSLKDFVLWQAKGILKNSIQDVEEFCKRFIEIDKNGTVWKDNVYEKLIAEFKISGWSVKELLTCYELCFSAFCKPKEGVIEAILDLEKSGYKLGLISNGKTPFQERNFNVLGISEKFDSIIVSEAVGYRKPQKEIFTLACTQLKTTPNNVIFIGDNPKSDIEGANNCGMYTIYIPGNYGEYCESANATCKDFKELVKIVQNAK